MKRTIETILNLRTGEMMEADDMFREPRLRESEIFNFRRELQEYYHKKELVYVCIFCKQSVGVRGRLDRRSYYFAHHSNKYEDCIIKTGTNLSLEQIKCIKYNGVKESEEHHLLKTQIAYYLEKDDLVESVETEKIYKDKAISSEWKKPDVLARLSDKTIAFELQLSTTFLSVVVSRTLFYKERGVFLIWVFPSFSVNNDLQQFTQKDVYYGNSFNVYVFDLDAREKSEELGSLVLKCFYKRYSISNDRVIDRWESSFVTIHELKYREDQISVCYFDSPEQKREVENELELQVSTQFELQHLERARNKAKKGREYLLHVYKHDVEPSQKYSGRPLNDIFTELDIKVFNDLLGFTAEKAHLISEEFQSGSRVNFLRLVCEEKCILINTQNMMIGNLNIFRYLIYLDTQWDFYRRIVPLFLTGYEMTERDLSDTERLYDKNFFNQTEEERNSIERWAFLFCLNKVQRRDDILKVEKGKILLFALLSLKYDLSIWYNYNNLRQYTMHVLQNSPSFGELFIKGMHFYKRYDQLLSEDKSGKLKKNLDKFLSSPVEQDHSFNDVIIRIFPELGIENDEYLYLPDFCSQLIIK